MCSLPPPLPSQAPIFFFFPHPAVIIDSSIPQSGFKWAGPRLQGFLRLYFQPHTTSHIVFIASIVEGFLALRHMSYFEIAFMFLCYTHGLSVNTDFKSNIQFIPSKIFNQQESMKIGARFGRGGIHFLVRVTADRPLGRATVSFSNCLPCVCTAGKRIV